MKDLRITYTVFKSVYGSQKVFYVTQGDGSYIVVSSTEGDGFIFITDTGTGSDKTDFEANIKPSATSVGSIDDAIALASYYSNLGVEVSFKDSRIIRRFGNLAAASAIEALLSSRAYNEPASQAQRSVKSSSASDTSAGAGARKVRLRYLDSNYTLKSEDITLNGTTAVNTVATDIRFIEDFFVIEGAAAVGAIELFPNTGGTGTAICGISATTENAFLCHHYVPAGKRAWVTGWGASVDDEVKFKLQGQARYPTNLVDINLDLINLMGIATPPSFLTFEKSLKAVYLAEKTYIRVKVVPNQATTTTIRGYIYVWEETA